MLLYHPVLAMLHNYGTLRQKTNAKKRILKNKKSRKPCLHAMVFN